MLTLFPSGLGALGCWYIPEAWAKLGSQDGLSWELTDLGRIYQPMSPAPWTWHACSPLHGPNLRSQGVLLQ